MSAQFLGEMNQVGYLFTSGTYANASGAALQSFGLVQSNNPSEAVNISNVRYTGTESRDVGKFVTTSKDYAGALTYYPQDFKFAWMAFGSVTEVSGTPYTHNISATNSDDGNITASGTNGGFVDFNIEDSHQVNVSGLNSIRTYNGCKVNSWTIAGGEDDLLSCDIDYIAQSVTPGSNTAGTYTVGTTKPFVFSDCLFHFPSGTVIDEMISFSFTINNNLKTRHYGNGSIVIAEPVPLSRDYSFDVTFDEDSSHRKTFYETYFQGGSVFNCELQIGTSATNKGVIWMSGCRLSADTAPTPNEGVIEEAMTIIPGTAGINVSDSTASYLPW